MVQKRKEKGFAVFRVTVTHIAIASIVRGVVSWANALSLLPLHSNVAPTNADRSSSTCSTPVANYHHPLIDNSARGMSVL